MRECIIIALLFAYIFIIDRLNSMHSYFHNIHSCLILYFSVVLNVLFSFFPFNDQNLIEFLQKHFIHTFICTVNLDVTVVVIGIFNKIHWNSHNLKCCSDYVARWMTHSLDLKLIFLQ